MLEDSSTYKSYSIEPRELLPGRWRAYVRRLDGRKITNRVPSAEANVIPTAGLDSFSPEAAVTAAKEMIDNGSMA